MNKDQEALSSAFGRHRVHVIGAKLAHVLDRAGKQLNLRTKAILSY